MGLHIRKVLLHSIICLFLLASCARPLPEPPVRRMVPLDGYIGVDVNEPVMVTFPLLTKGQGQPQRVALEGADHVMSFSIGAPIAEDGKLVYRPLTVTVSHPMEGVHSATAVRIIWSDGTQTRHQLGNLVFDVRSLPEPTIRTESYLGTWAGDYRVRHNSFLYAIELRNVSDLAVESVDLVYNVPGFSVVDVTAHTSSAPTAPATSLGLPVGENKDYRFRLSFSPTTHKQFFVFKPFVRAQVPGQTTLVRTGANVSYIPSLTPQDLSSVWDLAR